MISLIVFCVDKKANNFQYAYINDLNERIDVIARSLKSQIDIHNLFKIPNLVLLTNFPFSYKNITAIDLSGAECEKNFWGNKYTLPLKWVTDNKINDDIWLHDYDCFPQENFAFPILKPSEVGGTIVKPNYVNGGSLFIKKEDYNFFNTLKDIYDITHYHKSDEHLLNDLFFNKQHVIDVCKDARIVNIFKNFDKSCVGLGHSYNYSFARAKRTPKSDFIPRAIHFHPEKPEQHKCFAGKNIIRKELDQIFLEHCPIEYRNRNLVLYNKWRYPK